MEREKSEVVAGEAEMPRRRRLSAAEGAALLEEHRNSGVGAKEFCRQHGIPPSTFYRLRRGGRTKSKAEKFVEITPAKVPGQWAIEVEVPGGYIVRMQAGASAVTVAELARAIGGAR